MFLVWIVIACLFLALELFFPTLFLFLSFSFGSFVAALLALAGYSLYFQIMIGVGVILGALLILGYWIRRHEHKKRSLYETNVFRLIGKEGIIVEVPSNTGFGLVSIQGQTWSCSAENSYILLHGQRVRVVHVSGAHLIVRPSIGDHA